MALQHLFAFRRMFNALVLKSVKRPSALRTDRLRRICGYVMAPGALDRGEAGHTYDGN